MFIYCKRLRKPDYYVDFASPRSDHKELLCYIEGSPVPFTPIVFIGMKISYIDGGKPFDWGKTSEDYAKYRDIYPDFFYEKILERGVGLKGQKILDIETDYESFYCLLSSFRRFIYCPGQRFFIKGILGSGEVSVQTVFSYHQKENVVWAEYTGG